MSINRLLACLIGWLIIVWFIVQSFDWLIDWLCLDWLFDPSIDWLIGWLLFDWLFDPSIDWLIDWLIFDSRLKNFVPTNFLVNKFWNKLKLNWKKNLNNRIEVSDEIWIVKKGRDFLRLPSSSHTTHPWQCRRASSPTHTPATPPLQPTLPESFLALIAKLFILSRGYSFIHSVCYVHTNVR